MATTPPNTCHRWPSYGPTTSPCHSPRPGMCQTAAGGAGQLQGPGQAQPGAVSQDSLASPRLLASLGRKKQARVRRGIKPQDDRDRERALLLPSLLPQIPLQENTPGIQVCVTERQGGGGNHGEVRRDPTATVTVPRSELKTGRARSTDVSTGCAAPRQRGRLAGRAGAPRLHPRTDTQTHRHTDGTLSLAHTEVQPCPAPYIPSEQSPLSTPPPPMLTAPIPQPQHTPPLQHTQPPAQADTPVHTAPSPDAPPQHAQLPAQHTQPPAQLRRQREQRPQGWDLPIPVGRASRLCRGSSERGLAGSHRLHTEARTWLPGRRTRP